MIRWGDVNINIANKGTFYHFNVLNAKRNIVLNIKIQKNMNVLEKNLQLGKP